MHLDNATSTNYSQGVLLSTLPEKKVFIKASHTV